MAGVVAPFSTRAEFVLFHPPDSISADATSSYTDVRTKDGQYLTVVVGVNDLGANESVDVKLVQATASAGTGSKDVADAAITQLALAADDHKLSAITIDVRKLDEPGGFHWLAVTVDLSTGDTVDFFAVGIFSDGDAPPEASGLDSHALVIGEGY